MQKCKQYNNICIIQILFDNQIDRLLARYRDRPVGIADPRRSLEDVRQSPNCGSVIRMCSATSINRPASILGGNSLLDQTLESRVGLEIANKFENRCSSRLTSSPSLISPRSRTALP